MPTFHILHKMRGIKTKQTKQKTQKFHLLQPMDSSHAIAQLAMFESCHVAQLAMFNRQPTSIYLRKRPVTKSAVRLPDIDFHVFPDTN